ncbi:hypothetical protein CXG81DRAFT_28936 [Caulochytrium protostelioides]|uniref:Integrase catalytic domain-containing protein n=1 Tax=Caulochytrium protostelioides TaxID=1555241 RepID=A0A4P9WXN9_9FUNG|nr:hypothetical protein CXG81DRAFT_28936 [Caulochytrium protostelioides]|eukprot:RKO98241.1 hypothetical protein CXG81DRAFT_28936 [Caulochytrium protostelioides]
MQEPHSLRYGLPLHLLQEHDWPLLILHEAEGKPADDAATPEQKQLAARHKPNFFVTTDGVLMYRHSSSHATPFIPFVDRAELVKTWHDKNAIEHVTKWPIAAAVPDAKAWRVAHFIFQKIIPQFGSPAEIITDRGTWPTIPVTKTLVLR